MLCNRPYVALFLALIPFRAGPAMAQIVGVPKADSTIRAFITRLAAGDTAGIRAPMRTEDLAQSGITRDSVVRVLAIGLSVGAVRRMDVLYRTAFFPYGSSRVDEEVTYHLVGAGA